MSLLETLSSKEKLFESWDEIKIHKKVSSGPDGVTIEKFSRSLDKNIQSISEELRSNEYIFKYPKELKIRKDSFDPHSELRSIKVYNLKDKLVQKTLLKLIKDFFPDVENQVSVGFVKKGGVKEAMNKIKRLHSEGHKWLTSLDIMNFFDAINRKKLYEKIKQAIIKDSSINRLIYQCLNTIKETKISEYGLNFENDMVGIEQGSILAPFFSNIYLSEFDKVVTSMGIKAIRYADDLALLSKSKEDAEIQLKYVTNMLKNEYELDIHPPGSKKEPKYYQLNKRAEYLGLSFYVDTKHKWLIQPTDENIKKNKRILKYLLSEETPLYERLLKINLRLDGWFSNYHYVKCNNSLLLDLYKGIRDFLEGEISRLLIKEKMIQHKISRDQGIFLGIPKIARITQILSR